jgi:hypothetical protein
VIRRLPHIEEVRALAAALLCGCSAHPPSNPVDAGTDAADASTDRDSGSFDAARSFDAHSLPPPPPRLLAPMTSERVSRHEPLLRFEPPLEPDLDLLELELCSDRPCTEVEHRTDLTDFAGGLHRAPPLGPGVHFWRMRSVRVDAEFGERIASEWTPVWYFRVPVRDSEVDSASGVVLDVNGDGLADVARSVAEELRPGSSRFRSHPSALVHYGRRGAPLSSEPDWSVSLSQPEAALRDNGPLVAGDLNGDGYVDLVLHRYETEIEDPYTTHGVRYDELWIYLGSSTGLGAAPSQVIEAPRGPFDETSNHDRTMFEGPVPVPVGDVDDDGYADLVVGAILAILDGDMGGHQIAFLYRGGPDGLGALPADTSGRDPSRGTDSSWEGFAWGPSCLVLDSNGDGVQELVVHRLLLRAGLYELRGGIDPPDITSLNLEARMVPGASADQNGMTTGDFNGDGLGDLIFAAFPGIWEGLTAAVYFLPGRLGEPLDAARAERILEPPPSELGEYPSRAGGSRHLRFGTTIGSVGDVDGDGFDDLVIGNRADSGRPPLLFFGSEEGLRTDTFVTVGGSRSPLEQWVSGPRYTHADVDGDGLEDFGVVWFETSARGSEYYSSYSEHHHALYRGGSDFTEPAQTWTLEHPVVDLGRMVLGY